MYDGSVMEANTQSALEAPLAHRYIAVCDVLGFSNLTRQQPLPKLVADYRSLVSICKELTHFNSNLFPFGKESWEADLVKVAIFSDTLLVYTVPIEPKEYGLDIGTVSCFFEACSALLNAGIKNGMPLRVGVAFGQTYIEPASSLFVGEPIVDAYETEQAQDWIGGACHQSCSEAPFFDTAGAAAWQNVVLYHVPLHEGEKEMWAINWPRMPLHNERARGVILQFLSEKAEGSHGNKYRNAQEFVAHIETGLEGERARLERAIGRS